MAIAEGPRTKDLEAKGQLYHVGARFEVVCMAVLMDGDPGHSELAPFVP